MQYLHGVIRIYGILLAEEIQDSHEDTEHDSDEDIEHDSDDSDEDTEQRKKGGVKIVRIRKMVALMCWMLSKLQTVHTCCRIE